MKRSLQYLEAVVLSLISAWSAIGCLITALGLNVVPDTRMGLLWCAVCLGSMVLFSLRRGGLWGLLLTLALLAAAWFFLPLRQQLRNLLGTIAQLYDRAYGWGIPPALRDARNEGYLPIALLGCLVVESVVYAVFRRRGTPLAAALLVLSLSACLVIANTIPMLPCLFALLACLCLLLLTQSVRSEGASQGSRLTIAAALPVILCLGLLFYLAPQESYVNKTEPLRQQLLSYAQSLAQQLQTGQLGLPNYSPRRSQVNLSNLPSQPRLGLPVAELAAETTGPVYLRVQDFDEYTGTDWISSSGRQETLSGTGDALGAVVIRELTSQPGMLLPSYPAGNTVLEDGLAVNETAERVYRISRMHSAMTATPAGSNLKLPEGTGVQARSLVQQIIGDTTGVEATAAAIADFVRGCAEYDRTVQPMPQDAGDFALWFLESAERGYCVHFATASVILLRSAGIPARYVTGYKTDAIAGQTVRVTSDEAHAWAEYYNYKTWSWAILESTPGELELTPEETTAPAQTQPQATVPTQSPTLPEPTTPLPQPEVQKFLPLWLPLTLLGTVTALCGVQLQRFLRIRLRLRRQRRGPNNRRALARWEELTLLHRLLGIPVPEELEALAQKAMFSQHTLTREELNTFLEAARKCRAELSAKPWHKRLLYRYWFAVL